MGMALRAIPIDLRFVPRVDLIVHFSTMDIERNISQYFDALVGKLGPQPDLF